MPKTDVKKIVKDYAKKLKEANFAYSNIFLFGSQAKDAAREWSDIDVAVVSDRLKGNWEQNELLLWEIRRKVDSRIEPIGFTVEDFKSNYDPMVAEIKKTGIKIA